MADPRSNLPLDEVRRLVADGSLIDPEGDPDLVGDPAPTKVQTSNGKRPFVVNYRPPTREATPLDLGTEVHEPPDPSHDEDLGPAVRATHKTSAPTAEEAKAEPDVGIPTAVGRGVLQGATLYFSDEAGGGVQALLNELVRHAPGLAKHLGLETRYADELPTPGQSYEEGRDQERDANDKAEEQHPGYYLGSEAAGALLSPLNKLLSPLGAGAEAGVMERLLAGAGNGALQGATAGLGTAEGSVADQLQRALLTGGVGTLLGGAGEYLGGALADAGGAARSSLAKAEKPFYVGGERAADAAANPASAKPAWQDLATLLGGFALSHDPKTAAATALAEYLARTQGSRALGAATRGLAKIPEGAAVSGVGGAAGRLVPTIEEAAQ